MLLLFLLIICAVLLFFVLLVLLCLAAVNPLRVSFLLDSIREDARLILCWTPPLLNITVEMRGGRPQYSVYLFHRPIFQKRVLKRKRKGNQPALLRALSLSHTRAQIQFGLQDPSQTGLLCGALGLLGSYLHADDLELHPDFIPNQEYLRLRATTNVNLMATVVNYMQLKPKQS